MWCKYCSHITASPYFSAGMFGGAGVKCGWWHQIWRAQGWLSRWWEIHHPWATAGPCRDLPSVPGPAWEFVVLGRAALQLVQWHSCVCCMLAKSEFIPSPMHSPCVTALPAKNISRHFWVGIPGNLFVYWNDTTLPAGPCVKPSQAVYILKERDTYIYMCT